LEDVAKSGCKPHMKYKSLIMLLYLWLHTRNFKKKKSFFCIFGYTSKPAKCRSLVKTSQIMSFQNFQFNFLAKFRQYNKSYQSESLVQRFFLWLNSGTWLFFSKWLKICVCLCVFLTNSWIKKIPKFLYWVPSI
jgi:hypothetical protein